MCDKDKNRPPEDDAVFERAAKAVADADILLVVTGAGFSADSGLAVYNDVAGVEAYQLRMLEYGDICQPRHLDDDPELFYGFWGQCFNDYRNTKPHEGYDILARWRKDKIQSKISKTIQDKVRHKATIRSTFEEIETVKLTPYEVEDVAAGSFFSFTSNADGHFYDYFPAQEIHDCHGNVELWQCSDRDCESGIWRAPLDQAFIVDKETMLAPQVVTDNKREATVEMAKREEGNGNSGNGTARIGQTKGKGDRAHCLQHMPAGLDQTGWNMPEKGNWPRCGHCGALARPGIFMFGDFGWKYDMAQNARWELWREAVLELVENTTKDTDDPPIQVCVLEIGCGVRVATCRNVAESAVEEVLQKGGDATLVRVNPDYPEEAEGLEFQENTVSIRSGGLFTLEKMNEAIQCIENR